MIEREQKFDICFSGIKDIQIVTGQGVIKKVQFSHTPGVTFMPTAFDTANSKKIELTRTDIFLSIVGV